MQDCYVVSGHSLNVDRDKFITILVLAAYYLIPLLPVDAYRRPDRTGRRSCSGGFGSLIQRGMVALPGGPTLAQAIQIEGILRTSVSGVPVAFTGTDS
jgi:hypothetical protein